MHYQVRLKQRKLQLKRDVLGLLTREFLLDLNSANRILAHFFAERFLPSYYFMSNTAEDIAQHIFIITQKLDPDNDRLIQTSDNGNVITYFVNVGQEFPGKLARLVRENLDMGIVTFDSVKTRSGIRIVTLEKRGRSALELSESEREGIAVIEQRVRQYGAAREYKHTDAFLRSLPVNYFKEEHNSITQPPRVLRHLDTYEKTMGRDSILTVVQNVADEKADANEKLDQNEVRIVIAAKNPDREFILNVLTVVEQHHINMNRSYYDSFEHETLKDRVEKITIYVNKDTDLSGVEAALRSIPLRRDAQEKATDEACGRKLEKIIRSTSRADISDGELARHMTDLKSLIRHNNDPRNDNELNNLLLNCLSDFMKAADFLGIADDNGLLRELIGFRAFDDFLVPGRLDEITRNKPAYRVKHNCTRGLAYKGGLRIDPIVDFTEVAALAFMMTWKCARSRILFGGGKGGLMVQPRDFQGKSMDFFETLTNFGKSLFLVSGPFSDVPAGDVACGPDEIGHMFEGFKTALRELCMLSSGIKQGVGIIGNEVVSYEKASRMLRDNFGIDPMDEAVMARLIENEQYLELVAAAQITGKPKMGIAARTGATGKGLCYSILAVVANRYRDGQWQASESLSAEETELVTDLTQINEQKILAKDGAGLIGEDMWRVLTGRTFRKLLKDKRVIVQGAGKVGGAILRELTRYDVNVIAVADAGGAVVGDMLDVAELLEVARSSASKSVIEAEKNVEHRIKGARQGTAVLEMECDVLVLAALENAVTAKNAPHIKAGIVACGSNGPNTPKAERILAEAGRNTTVLYDFLANGGGVIASYFEWLRNLTERFRYEAETIRQEPFDIDVMEPCIMPEFKDRIKDILIETESEKVTRAWNELMRDIMFAAVNEDYAFAGRYNVSMKTGGYINAILRILAALLLKLPGDRRLKHWAGFSERTRELLKPCFAHPEARLHNKRAAEIASALYAAVP